MPIANSKKAETVEAGSALEVRGRTLPGQAASLGVTTTLFDSGAVRNAKNVVV